MLFEKSGRRAYNKFVYVNNQKIHVAQMPAQGPRISSIPLLIFNGIGANLELLEPLVDAIHGIDVIALDIPGTGSSPTPTLPYRYTHIADMVDGLLQEMGIDQVDVIGISWGGGLAQQFAHDHPDRCRRLILAATAAGLVMVPGHPKVLWKMATPRRYLFPNYMTKIAGDIYGGLMRKDPNLVKKHTGNMRSRGLRGYYYQLLCIAGWTSLFWLHRLEQETLVIAGRDDPIVPPANAKIMHMRLKRSVLKYLDDGHLFAMTMADETARLIEDFLGDKTLIAARDAKAAAE